MDKYSVKLKSIANDIQDTVIKAITENRMDVASFLAPLALKIQEEAEKSTSGSVDAVFDSSPSASTSRKRKMRVQQDEWEKSDIMFEQVNKSVDQASLVRATEKAKIDSNNMYGERAGHGERTTEEEYRPYIIKALNEMGGEGQTARVTERVKTLMERDNILRPIDYQPLPKSGHTRWYITCCFARKHMVASGELDRNSPHGIWRLTNKK